MAASGLRSVCSLRISRANASCAMSSGSSAPSRSASRTISGYRSRNSPLTVPVGRRSVVMPLRHPRGQKVDSDREVAETETDLGYDMTGGVIGRGGQRRQPRRQAGLVVKQARTELGGPQPQATASPAGQERANGDLPAVRQVYH